MTALQLNIFLLALGAVQGLLLSLLLFRKRNFLPGHAFLATYLGVMLLQVLMKIASKLWLMQNIDPLYQFSYQLPFLYGPLLYLFVVRYTGYRQIRIKDWFHFIPVFVVLVVMIVPGTYNTWPAFFNLLFDAKYAAPLQVVSIVVYHVSALFILKKFNKLQWLKHFTIASMVVCSVVALVIALMYYNNPEWKNLRFGFIALTFFIYWISYKALSQPELFAVIRGNYGHETVSLPPPALKVHLPVKKYSNSGLSTEELSRIIAALEEKIKKDRPYLDPQLTIDDLAQSVNCSRHHLSQALNEQLGQTFYDYINQYRVAEAKLLLSDPAKASLKVAALAFDAGFNSISTFNEVFKKITGQTPTQFRKKPDQDKLKKLRV
jgi:AraC-like DNA-binding protein